MMGGNIDLRSVRRESVAVRKIPRARSQDRTSGDVVPNMRPKVWERGCGLMKMAFACWDVVRPVRGIWESYPKVLSVPKPPTSAIPPVCPYAGFPLSGTRRLIATPITSRIVVAYCSRCLRGLPKMSFVVDLEQQLTGRRSVSYPALDVHHWQSFIKVRCAA